MAASVNVNVSGTWHSATPWVNVSGTWHKLVSGWANVAGTWVQIFAGIITDTFSLGAASSNPIGYVAAGHGTLTGATLTGGNTITSMGDNTFSQFNIQINGFTAGDPGKAWLQSIVINGHTYLGSAATYSFTGGGVHSGSWSWTPVAGLVAGNTYPGTIIHS